MQSVRFFLIAVLIVFIGCGGRAENQNPASVEKKDLSASEEEWDKALGNGEVSDFKPFPVYTDKGSRDNHYIPSGFMPDGNCLTFKDRWTKDCHSGTTCIKIVYDVSCSLKGQQWAGIYWLNPANNWGKQKGGYNLTGATKLKFWAKGEKGGERIKEFKIGGVSSDYPDSDSAVIGEVILTPEWKEYSIDLRGKDLSYISGGFSWTTNVDVNPEECTFYLDDIGYE